MLRSQVQLLQQEELLFVAVLVHDEKERLSRTSIFCEEVRMNNYHLVVVDDFGS